MTFASATCLLTGIVCNPHATTTFQGVLQQHTKCLCKSLLPCRLAGSCPIVRIVFQDRTLVDVIDLGQSVKSLGILSFE